MKNQQLLNLIKGAIKHWELYDKIDYKSDLYLNYGLCNYFNLLYNMRLSDQIVNYIKEASAEYIKNKYDDFYWFPCDSEGAKQRVAVLKATLEYYTNNPI